MADVFEVCGPVRRALGEGRPVVALETAVLTHGLPRPLNLEVFREMEAAVAEAGAVPAPVGLVAGRLEVGLSPGGVVRLATGEGVRKAGLADLAPLAAAGADAGTTVGATLRAAQAAGIEVFATGGLGGVHPGAAASFDISGDLAALSRFGGCVVCSGPKAVLDVAATYQSLETLGVTVLAYGTWELPAFTCAASGLRARHRVDRPEEVARAVRARNALGLPSAVVAAHPPPPEQAVEKEALQAYLARASERLERSGVGGPAVTPFLLQALAEASGGATLEANRALLVANARLAARIAAALAGGGAPGP
ncbi:MAG: pseudouridine-5'-phosphate glycosidase [Deferrisomatales bacterium]